MRDGMRRWLSGAVAAALLLGAIPGMVPGLAEAKVPAGTITVDGVKEPAWDAVPSAGTSPEAGWQGFRIDNLKLANDDENLYYWVDAVNVPNWADDGQFIDIALQINDIDSGISGAPYGAFHFEGTDKKPSYHILHRIKGDSEVRSAAVYASSDLAHPILGTESSLEGAAFAADRTSGFEGSIPLTKLGLKQGDTVRAIAVLSGNNAGEHGAFDVVPEAESNPVADSWNEASSRNELSTYGIAYTIETFRVTIDGSKDEAWDQAPTLGRSETANQFADSPAFRIDNLRLYNDGHDLYYWLDAVSVPNWGENGLYVDIALNVDGQDSGVPGNPWNSQFDFSGAAAKPQFHIVQRIKNDQELAAAAVYASADMADPILASWTSLNGAAFAVNRTEGFEGRIPLSLLGLTNGSQVRAIAVLSGNDSGLHGAFDVIPENPGNEVADRWNASETGSNDAQGAYSDDYTVRGAVEELSILSASPGIGAVNVPIGLPGIAVKFNDTVTGTVYAAPELEGAEATYAIAGDTLTFAPSGPLAYGTTYRVKIPARSLDSALFGELSKDLSFTFTTEADPLTKRYVHFYYDRPGRDYEDWNLWTWSTGLADGQVNFAEDRDGMKFAEIPVSDDANTVGFKVRRGTDWAPGSVDVDIDRFIAFAPGQKTAKAFVTQGVQAIRQLDHVTGPVLDNGVPTFYYRDDALFRSNGMDTIDGVKVVVEQGGETRTYDMAYDAQQEYFTAAGEPSSIGKGYYQFEVTSGGTTTIVNDRYNPVTENGKSVFEYRNPGWTMTAAFPAGTAHPGSDAVLALQVEGGTTAEVKEIHADLSAVGGSSRERIDPALMKHTVAVGDAVSPGGKVIPVTLADVYGNRVTASASLQVAADRGDDGKPDFDWDEARIYFVLTDRFYNGDSANDDPNGEGYDKSHLETYHGGDFQGLIDKLDYIGQLGVNTLWITPIVDNIDFNVGKGAAHRYQYGYHGYWAKDFTRLDEHLGDLDKFKELIDKAHDRGIKIMVDVVVNHVGYGLKQTDTNASGATNYPTEADRDRFKDMIRMPAGSGDVTGELAGLPDLATENEDVRAQIVRWQADWLNRARTDRGDTIDYFRIDTVKHVDHTTWKALKNAVAAINPDFKMIGEYFGGSIDVHGGYLGNGEMDSVLDFEFKAKAKDFVDGSIDSVDAYLESRNDKLGGTVTVGQFLSSHDEEGFLYSVGFDEGKLKVAAALQITSRGQPVVYYGEELGSSGPNANFDPILGENRRDMPWDRLEEKAGLLTHYRKLLNTRAAHSKAFSKGSHRKVAGGNEEGYLVFDRSYQDEHVLVGLNTTDSAKNVTLDVPFGPGRIVIDEYSGTTYTVNGGKQVTVSLPARDQGGTFILAARGWSGSGGSDGNVVVGIDGTLGTEPFAIRESDLAGQAGRGTLTFEVPGPDGKSPVTVTLPAHAADLAGGGGIELKTERFAVLLPPSVLKDLQSLAPAGNPSNARIQLTVGEVSSEKADSWIRHAAESNRAAIRMASSAYSFSLSVVDSGWEAKPVTRFREPITITFAIDPDTDPELLGIYYIDDEGVPAFVGGTVRNGQATAEIDHFSDYAVLEYDKTFTDVAAGFWAYRDIQVLAARHIASGRSNTRFDPDGAVTRAEFAALLVRALGIANAGAAANPFADVAEDAWYAAEISAAYEAGLASGVDASHFRPDARITREEMAAMTARALAKLGKAPAADGNPLARFADGESVSAWAREGIRMSLQANILAGGTNGRLMPGRQATRAEAVAVMRRMMTHAGLSNG